MPPLYPTMFMIRKGVSVDRGFFEHRYPIEKTAHHHSAPISACVYPTMLLTDKVLSRSKGFARGPYRGPLWCRFFLASWGDLRGVPLLVPESETPPAFASRTPSLPRGGNRRKTDSINTAAILESADD